MIQEIVIGVVFLAALAYVSTLVVRSFNSKEGCATGCGKCSVADLQKLESEIKKNSI